VNEDYGYILPLDAFHLLGISNVGAVRERRIIILLDE
jgi:hypothetical protein